MPEGEDCLLPPVDSYVLLLNKVIHIQINIDFYFIHKIKCSKQNQ